MAETRVRIPVAVLVSPRVYGAFRVSGVAWARIWASRALRDAEEEVLAYGVARRDHDQLCFRGVARVFGGALRRLEERPAELVRARRQRDFREVTPCGGLRRHDHTNRVQHFHGAGPGRR